MKKLIRFLFKVLTILVVDLVVAVISSRVILIDKFLPREAVVLAGMLIVLLLFYFLVAYIEKAANAVLKLTISLGKVVPWKTSAVLLILLLLDFIVFLLYYLMWFEKFPSWLPF